MSTFIEKDKKIFVFHGLTYRNLYPRYETPFDNTMSQFKDLWDPKRINVVPDRIRIRSARTTDTLENVLQSFGVPNEKLKEMVQLNGGDLNQVIPANTLIKEMEKDSK